MKPLLPFALLGSFGVAGVIVGTGAGGFTTSSSTPSPMTQPAPTPTPTPTTSTPPRTDLGALRVEASFERTHLPADTSGDTFARVALIGRAQTAQTARVPVSLTLVIDRSGSMGSEQKMESAENAACSALNALQPGDRFSVVSFDNGADVLVDDVTVGASGRSDARTAACEKITALSARGGTDMIAGLHEGGERALAIAAQGRVNRLLLLSDGQPDVTDGLAGRADQLAKRGVTTTTIGLGTDYNEDLMASIADAGLGNSYFVDAQRGGAQQLASIFQTELSSMAEVVAQNASITLTPRDGAEITDVIGFSFDRSAGRVIVPVGDVYAARTVDVLVRVHHGAHAAGAADVVGVDVGYDDPSSKAHGATTLALRATFTTDTQAVAASTVEDVAIKATEWQTSQALLKANEAYNRGDFADGDRVLNEQKAAVSAAKARFGTGKLDSLLGSVDAYQAENTSGGVGTRAEMNKKAKAIARDVARATGTYKK